MTLPPAMGSAMVFLDGGTTLRCSAAPDGDAILTGVSQNAIDLGVSRDWTVLLWKSWLEATDIAGAGELVLPAALDVPGWDAAWGLDPALRAASSWTLGVDGETRDPSGALTSYFRTERSGRFGPQP